MKNSVTATLLRVSLPFLSAVSWLLFPMAYGQPPTESGGWPPLQVIGVEQGLPQAFVSGVVQDDDGFIWVGTLGGLARYDGRQIVPFYHQTTNPASPMSNGVIGLEMGRPNDLWLHYASGEIDRMDTRTGRCQHFPRLAKILRALPLCPYLHADHRRNLWGIIPGQGLFRYDIRHDRFIRYRRATNHLISDTINTLTEDRQGRIWAIAPAGISQLSPDKEPVVTRQFPVPIAGLASMALNGERMRAFVRPNGELLLNTRTHLQFIDTTTLAIRPVMFAKQFTVDQPLLEQSADGTAWLVAGGTLYRYTDGRGLTALWHYPSPTNTRLNELLETSLCLDRAGVLWLGANTKGLFRFDLAAAPLQAYRNQTTFCVEALQTGLGLSLPTVLRWPFDNPKAPSSYYFRTDYDRRGHLWMGIGSQVGYYSGQTHSFTLLPDPGPANLDVVYGFLRGLSISPGGQVWIVSLTGTPYQFDAPAQRWKTPFGRLAVEANDLLADDRALWVTTIADGLLRLDVATHTQRRFHFETYQTGHVDQPLLDLHQDVTHPDWLWIGSYQGLLLVNKRTGRYQRFTTADGLPNNTVYSILSDRQGYLWLSTNRGLCRFHPVTHTTLTIGLSDGLVGEEFNRFHHLLLPDGRLAFGGVEGWVLFDPARINPDATTPEVAITGLKINNQPVDPAGRPTPLPQVFNTLTDLRLTHDQNYLTVDFAALNYHQPGRVTYRYQLLGYDTDWTKTTQPTAGYTKLPPGHYTLRINAANTTGQWSRQVREVVIAILPPPWASNWAYGLYALLIGSAIFGLARFRTTRTRERQELMLRQRQADELRRLDREKTRFFTNVSHELRTPLTLMLGPLSSVLNRHRIDAHDEQLIRTADRSARQLLGLVNELLDLTRLEAGKLALHPQTVRLTTLLSNCLTPFAEQAQQLGITLTLEPLGTDDPLITIDAGKLNRVIQNLLANACKFTPPGGSVTLRATTIESRLWISVIDTGRGIHPDDLPYVFDRYFQTQQPDAPLDGGTGIGLALCQELVRLMQGTISVESTPGRGSSFYVDIPLAGPTDKVVNDDPAETAAPGLPAVVPAQPEHAPPNGMAVCADEPVHASVSPAETVLVVEDNDDLRAYLTAVLTPSLRVLTAANGQAALDRLADLSRPPSLIISDIMMPLMDGFQLLETLKAHPTYRTIPVVMLTARTDAADKLRALRLGVDDYLLKPFDEAELTARVTALLHNQRERQAPVLAEPEDGAVDHAETAPVISADEQVWLAHLEQLIAGRLGQFDLTADELADDLAMTRRTFYRTIKRLTGLTPAQYVAEARFREARRLLETRQVTSVKQVAYRVGYRQAGHFAQLYQQRFGKSPADYQ